jgi:hypothetical protein
MKKLRKPHSGEERNMPAFLYVSSDDARTAAEAEEYVQRESGGAVFAIAGQTTEVYGGYQVAVFSLDGGSRFIEDLATSLTDATDADRLTEREQFDSEPHESRGWAPYSNPAKRAGKE